MASILFLDNNFFSIGWQQKTLLLLFSLHYYMTIYLWLDTKLANPIKNGLWMLHHWIFGKDDPHFLKCLLDRNRSMLFQQNLELDNMI